MVDRKKLTNELNLLLTRTYDAKRGYVEAANHVSSVGLNNWFEENAAQRTRFGQELKEEIRRLDGTPDKGSSLLGEVHQAWMHLKDFFTSNDEVGMLEECERGEEKALNDYQSMLDNPQLPVDTKILLEQQMMTIQSNLRTIARMKKAYSTMPA